MGLDLWAKPIGLGPLPHQVSRTNLVATPPRLAMFLKTKVLRRRALHGLCIELSGEGRLAFISSASANAAGQTHTEF